MHTNFGVKITITNKAVEELSKRGILLSPVKSMNGLNSLRILFSNVYIINKTSSNEMNKLDSGYLIYIKGNLLVILFLQYLITMQQE